MRVIVMVHAEVITQPEYSPHAIFCHAVQSPKNLFKVQIVRIADHRIVPILDNTARNADERLRYLSNKSNAA